MLLGNKSYTIGKPVYLPLKWWHIRFVSNMHLCDEQYVVASMKKIAKSMEAAQPLAAIRAKSSQLHQ